MGYDAECTLSLDGRSFRGTARLESSELTFRGETRLAVVLAAVSEVRTADGVLLLTFDGRRAGFRLGDQAEKWATRIAHPPSRLDKLGVKPGMRVAMAGMDDRALEGEIASRGATVLSGRATGLDLLFAAVESPRDLDRLPSWASRIKPDGAVWLIRGKGKGAAVSESASMAAGKRAGLVDVKVVSFSSTHSAEKYVVPVARRGRSRSAI